VGYAAFSDARRDGSPTGWPAAGAHGGVVVVGSFTPYQLSVPKNRFRRTFCLRRFAILLGAGEAIIYPASKSIRFRVDSIGERESPMVLIFAGVGVGAGVTQF